MGVQVPPRTKIRRTHAPFGVSAPKRAWAPHPRIDAPRGARRWVVFMTARPATVPVPAVVISAASSGAAARRAAAPTPPVPDLPAATSKPTALGSYALARVDHRGRVTDSAVERA